MLVEIKKGEVGRGLLVEQDGFVSLDIKNNRQLCESIGSNSDYVHDLPRPFVVHAVFQKFGVENANGRVYPEGVLKREVEKYQKAIDERRAFGECYTPDVLILTENDGWKRLGDVKEGESVLTLNTNTNEIEPKPILKKISYEYEGDMVRIKGRSINDLVTPNHKFPLFTCDGNLDGFYDAQTIYEGSIKGINKKYIKKTGSWVGAEPEYIKIDRIDSPSKAMLRYHKDCDKDLFLKPEPFMKFLGIYLSEGDVDCRPGHNQIRIHQVKSEVCGLIHEMLTELGLPYTFYKSGKKTVFTIIEPRLHTYVKKLGNCYTKYIPNDIKQLSKKLLSDLYEWFVIGDGRVRGDKRLGVKAGMSDDVFSVSKQLILDLNEIQLKIGYNGKIHTEKRDNDRHIEGRLIEGKNCHPLHFSYRSLSKGVFIDKRFLTINKEYYKGLVECIEVENHTWFVMSEGNAHWTGNCNHPEGTSIDVERIAINVTELHWEGRTLVGQLEIPISEGFRRFGIISCLADTVAHWILSGLRIGVSSRAIGTVKQIGRVLQVNDDLEIIGFDVVGQPSTRQAYITTSYDQLAPFKESAKKDDSKLIKDDKYSAFEEWLNG